MAPLRATKSIIAQYKLARNVIAQYSAERFPARFRLLAPSTVFLFEQLGQRVGQDEITDSCPKPFVGIEVTGSWLQSFSIITTDVNELAARVHSRMPLILHPSTTSVA